MTGFHIDRKPLNDAAAVCWGLLFGSLLGATVCIITALSLGN